MKNFFIWIATAIGSLVGIHAQPNIPSANVPTNMVHTQTDQSSASSSITGTQSDSYNDATADWQIYKGVDFTIKYPPGWTIMDDYENKNNNGQTSIIFEGKKSADSYTPNLRLAIYRKGGPYNDIVLSVAAAVANHHDGEVSTSTISIEGVTGTRVEEISPAVGASWYNDDKYILFQKGIVVYQLQGSSEKSDPSGPATFDSFYKSLKLSQ